MPWIMSSICTRLQWGHGFSAVEIEAEKPELIGENIASMGPRLFSRGNVASCSPHTINWPSLQWGHGFSAVEIRAESPDRAGRAPCFNGATAFQPWKCDGRQPDRGPGMGFNGATAFQPWKWLACRLTRTRAHTLQWGHGFSAVEMWLRRRRYSPPLGCFNGATAFQPWKCCGFH